MSFADWLLVCTVVLAWYHVGFVWLVQVVAWPLFAYVGPGEFEAYHWAWWRGIRYILFIPSGLSLIGSTLLLFFRPPNVPLWILASALALYIFMYVLTAVWFGPEQARLTDTKSPQFTLIIRTHWARTALVSAYGLFLFAALTLRMAH